MQRKALRSGAPSTGPSSTPAGNRAAGMLLIAAAFLAGCNGSVDLPETIVPNEDPIANAGPDQTVKASETANLDGRGSRDPDGDLFTYAWNFESIPAGSAATLVVDTDKTPHLASFDTDVPGNYVARLTVEDVFGGSGTDTVTVTAEEVPTRPPVANAGPDQKHTFSQMTIFLDGTGSSDPDGDALTYAWEIVDFAPIGALPDVPVALIGADSATPSFDIFDPNTHIGIYTIELTVSDGTLSDTATVVVTIEKALPTASILFGSGLVLGAIFGLRRRWRA